MSKQKKRAARFAVGSGWQSAVPDNLLSVRQDKSVGTEFCVRLKGVSGTGCRERSICNNGRLCATPGFTELLPPTVSIALITVCVRLEEPGFL